MYKISFLLVFLVFFSGCSHGTPLMTTPLVMQDGVVPTLASTPKSEQSDEIKIFIATDRLQSGKNKPADYFSAERSASVNIGTATIKAEDRNLNWASLEADSTSASRKHNTYLHLTNIEDYGKLWTTEPPAQFIGEKYPSTTNPNVGPADRFAQEINDQLDKSDVKDIYLFIHGYNTSYEKHFEIGAEIFHFVGRRGVMVAYSWPSQSHFWDYFSDKETTLATVRHFRLLIRFLANSTHARRIHIIAHSAGNPVVVRALTMLRLKDDELTTQEIHEKYRIGNVILAAPDMDLQDFQQCVYDGFYDLPEHVTIYMSTLDRALRVSHWLVGEPRLGDAIKSLKLEETRVLVNVKNADMIDVSYAQTQYPDWLGHGYYHQNPWVSGDIALRLLYNASPEQRGLWREPESGVWKFPKDYADIAKPAAAKIVSQAKAK